MKPIFLIAVVFLNSCTLLQNRSSQPSSKPFTEEAILHELDLAFKNTPSPYFPSGRSQDIQYNFFLDLEHGYTVLAGSRIHLYADSVRWAIVFEKSGYENRGFNADIQLHYFGNCIAYPVDVYPEQNYITNTSDVELIPQAEFARIENKVGSRRETFEFISPDTKVIAVREKPVVFNPHYQDYEKLRIPIQDTVNPRNLIGFSDFLRYLQATDPELIRAKDSDIRLHIPADLPKLMTIDSFHYESVYGSMPPSVQETYKLLALILVNRDTTLWKPTQRANSDWRNWKSGEL